MKTFLWFILLAFLGTASVIKPDLSAHQRKIYETAHGSPVLPPEELSLLPEWKELTFRDFYFATATQSRERASVVSYGMFRYVKVVDREWWANPFGKKLAPAE